MLNSRATGPMVPASGPIKAHGSIVIRPKTVSAATKERLVCRTVYVLQREKVVYVHCGLLLPFASRLMRI